jgi:hypothetical protein
MYIDMSVSIFYAEGTKWKFQEIVGLPANYFK